MMQTYSGDGVYCGIHTHTCIVELVNKLRDVVYIYVLLVSIL